MIHDEMHITRESVLTLKFGTLLKLSDIEKRLNPPNQRYQWWTTELMEIDERELLEPRFGRLN